MADFKHLSDTNFPNVSNVDVYAYENTYDYTRWDIDTEIRLLDVPWDGFDNAIEFEDEAARNEWIDTHTKATYTLDTEQYLQPDGTIKLPIPFNVACLYNYIAIKYPTAPVQYGTDTRLDRFFYFVTATKQLAPSTTECTLMLDAWTTYQHKIDISYMMLARGHAPMAEVSAQRFIQNPIQNAGNILAPDVNFASAPSRLGGWLEAKQYKQIAEFIFNRHKDEMFVVIATTGDVGANWGTVETDSMHAPAAVAPVFFGGIGYQYIAVSVDKAGSFFDQMFAYRPQMAPTIKAIFYVPQAFITLGQRLDLFGVECHYVNTRAYETNMATLNLDMFEYDDKYRNIAKLYTYPYAYLELTNEKGDVSRVPIEQTNGKFNIRASVNLFAPFLGLDVIPLSLGGGTSHDVEFALTEERAAKIAGAWYEHIYHWDIPTYAVYQDQRSAAKYNRYFHNKQATTERVTKLENTRAINNTVHENALATADNNWRNARRTNNTVHENALASADNNWRNARRTNNTVHENALASADNNWRNARRTNNTVHENALATADNNWQNAKRGYQASYDNTERDISNTTANVGLANANNIYKVGTLQNGGSISQIGGSGGYLADTYDANLNKLSNDTDADQILMYQVAGITQSTLAAGGVVNAGSSVVSGIGNGASAGLAGGAPGAAIGAAAGGITSGITSAAGTMIALTENQSLVEVNKQHSKAKFESARDNMMSMFNAQKNYSNGIAQADNDLNTNMNTNNANTGHTNNLNTKTASDTSADLTKTTADDNAGRQRNTSDDNANLTKTTADDNAGRQRNTSDDNANLTKTTADDNAGRQRNTADDNANLTKTTADDNAGRQRNTADSNANRTSNCEIDAILRGNYAQYTLEPDPIGEVSNAGTASNWPMGLWLNVVTQSNTALAQAGDQMLRYGYMLHAAWNVSRLQVMRKFSYWEAEDLWLHIGGDATAPRRQATETIKDMFKNGITIWSNPDDIGATSIYDNI